MYKCIFIGILCKALESTNLIDNNPKEEKTFLKLIIHKNNFLFI